jgi:hypothetical protein
MYNCRLDEPQPVQFARPTETFAISSILHTATSDELRNAGVTATDEPSLVIDDFSTGFQDWYLLSAENPHHWQYWTRKINDPKWRGRPGYRLDFDVKVEEPNELVVVLTENFFRPYRGAKRDSVAVVRLEGNDNWETVTLSPSDFKTVEDQRSLASWEEADLLGFRAYYGDAHANTRIGSARWAGSQPTFRNPRWSRR